VSAGTFSERDRINGVSANVMLGQVAPCGTGDSTLQLDLEELANLTSNPTTQEHTADARVQELFEF
jgi:hypothetical protein